MIVNWGVDVNSVKQGQQGSPVILDLAKAINPHMLIVGMTGSGKSHTLRHVVESIARTATTRVRFHVFDVHGDLSIPGASTCVFGEASPFGLNPLAVSPDPQYGGVRKKIQSFIATLNKVRQLGTKQEAVLRYLLQDLYAANGFFADDPDSWERVGRQWKGREKKHPTIEDVKRFSQHKLRTLYLGTDHAAAAALEKLNRAVQKRNAQHIASHRGGADDNDKAMLEKLSKDTIDAYTAYVNSISTGRELDELIRYDSKDVLKSVVERVENLAGIGIFKNVQPPFDPRAAIFRYDLRALSSNERRLFVMFQLEEIFQEALRTGIKDRVTDFAVLDEAHIFADDDPDNVINLIAKEARKFGLGLIAASQSPTHFSEDFLTSVGTKVIRKLDEMYFDGTSRKLKLDQRALGWLRPRRNMLVQARHITDERSPWMCVAAS